MNQEYKCEKCGDEFFGYASQKRRFCSPVCYWKNLLKNSEVIGLSVNERVLQYRRAHREKFYDECSRCGLEKQKGSIQCRKCEGQTRKSINHVQWIGNRVGYRCLHLWVARELGKPSTCESCGAENLSGRQIHWANKSREYRRILTDWIRLCVKCHKAYDRNQLVLR